VAAERHWGWKAGALCVSSMQLSESLPSDATDTQSLLPVNTSFKYATDLMRRSSELCTGAAIGRGQHRTSFLKKKGAARAVKSQK
jgi:hypothetical protein